MQDFPHLPRDDEEHMESRLEHVAPDPPVFMSPTLANK